MRKHTGHRRGAASVPSDKQPTWCTLPRAAFGNVVRLTDSRHPENILLTWQGALSQAPADSQNASKLQGQHAQQQQQQHAGASAGALTRPSRSRGQVALLPRPAQPAGHTTQHLDPLEHHAEQARVAAPSEANPQRQLHPATAAAGSLKRLGRKDVA